MSEFRQYRLASQLLDRFNCLKDPKTYAGQIFSPELKGLLSADVSSRVQQLSQKASDPVAFINDARYLKEAFPYHYEKVIVFLDSLSNRKAQQLKSYASPSQHITKASSVTLETPQRPELKTSEADDDKSATELDDMARRLESVSHRLGRPVSSHIPVPLSSGEDEGDFVQIQLVRGDSSISLARLPLSVQELCVIEDLLFLIMNLDGKYFSYKQGSLGGAGNVIFVDESVDGSILNRLKPVLRAAFCCSRLIEFVGEKSRMRNGQVIQAFAHALDGLLKEFFQVVMALDRKFKARELGLHQFCFHLSPYTRSLQSLLHLTFEIETRDITGGALIKALEDKIASVSGDRQLRATYSSLLEGSVRPFMEVLGRWLSTGAFNDAHHEFMISDTKRGHGAMPESANGLQEDYFNSRYVLNPRNVPRLLEDLQQKALLTGIYRNIRTYLAKDQQAAASSSVSITQWDRRSLAEAVSGAYAEVNGSLMSSLFRSSKLFATMCAAKRFFFVEKSDFLDNFISSSTSDLMKTAKDLSLHQLHSSFELALKNSSLANDDFQDAFTCELASGGLYDSLVKIIQSSSSSTGAEPSSAGTSSRVPKVAELINLNMRVSFPESLIMNSKALAKYQFVFRHVLQCVELIHGLAVPLARYSAIKATQQRHFEMMKQTMLQFVRAVHYYVCYNVLGPQWERFSTALQDRKFSSVEEITDTHMDFLDTCLRECMLTNSKLVQLTSMIWSTCTKFSALILELNNRIEARTLTESMFSDVMGKFSALHQHFLKYVRVLIEALQYYAARDCDHYIANFLSSLDCQFYSSA